MSEREDQVSEFHEVYCDDGDEVCLCPYWQQGYNAGFSAGPDHLDLYRVAGYLSAALPGLHQTHPEEVYGALVAAFRRSTPKGGGQ